MPKALTLGNGKILLNLDSRARVRDLYYPYVGLENHIGGHYFHRIGVFADGRMSWFDSPEWDIKITLEPNTLVGKIEAKNFRLGVALVISDTVYNEKNVFVRRMLVKNIRAESGTRPIKVFFNHQFEIYESHTAHTAYFDPRYHAIIHYRNQRVFLIKAQLEGQDFNDYSTGAFGSEGKEGTHCDADDGELQKNNIEHGQADSVIGLSSEFGPSEEKILYYWLAVGDSIPAVVELNNYVIEMGPGHLLETTRNFWHAWVTRQNFSFHGLPPGAVDLFYRSLFITRLHVSDNGAIIASGDSDILQNGKDTYGYVWLRDASYSALALTRAGDLAVARNFFSFCDKVISEAGYFMHKYSPDGSLGSSWHPWPSAGEDQLPIQEDSTATMLWALWHYYRVSKDLEFVETIYNSLIKKAADFMVLYLSPATGLPKPSYDLWEEKLAVHTYTAASVYGGLTAAANFAELLGKRKAEAIYREAAERVRRGINEYLYDPTAGLYYKSLDVKKGELIFDKTLDVSTFYGLFTFGILAPGDKKLKQMAQAVEKDLATGRATGGLPRYAGDNYKRAGKNFPENAWFITSLWLAEYYILDAKAEADLAPAKRIFDWCIKYALSTGILSEQLHPVSGEQLSVAPLVWSQAEYVLVVTAYLDKLEQLGVCQACNPVY